ncbi:2-iminoacetate synthase ThiH [Desulfovibrio ferrophilus]|uniref:Thiazole biosynthesis protein ThiH n=1 Tax=Desulfovibrio ferrophilus TaxID=241368 RepID=A0A2Z6AY53_9BACT|nr:2-iminoacetate synthase ThiH [Desulfovibrio ferrophilus]BBD08194.1 thiazole biosynthesis protein ThiH [Desulfovibrio ferrophilus]
MSFLPACKELDRQPLGDMIRNFGENAVLRALDKPTLSSEDYMALLSPAAEPHLEAMAQAAHKRTLQHFGRTIQLFTPLYLANHCSNHCVYCGFNARNDIPRSQLSMDELRVEAEAIAATGLKHLLILTGEAPNKAGVDYLEEAVTVLAPIFPSVSIEVFPMDEADYVRLIGAGVDGLTVFQETYNKELYEKLHPAGPKRVYDYRLEAPDRGCRAGMRVVNIGGLLGLDDWRRESFMTGMHAAHLLHAYPGVDIAVSLPRMRPHTGAFQPAHIVDDRQLVQIMTALRLFLPRVSITISTREAPEFRDNILPLGVTRMSAGVTTAVGGHTKGNDTAQFDISDPRSVDEMCSALKTRGYQPVFKDWEPITSPGSHEIAR